MSEQLYAKEQQKVKAYQKATNALPGTFPPITIINVLPGQHYTTPLGSSQDGTPAPEMPPTFITINRLDIPGKRDAVVGEYCTWQQEQVEDEEQKADFQRARDYLIKEGIDLELICGDPTVADDLVEIGIKKGVARRVIGDIVPWANKKQKRDHSDNQGEQIGQL